VQIRRILRDHPKKKTEPPNCAFRPLPSYRTVQSAEIQKLIATGGLETSVREAIPSLNGIKSMQVDYGKLVSESKKLSQGFLKEWIGIAAQRRNEAEGLT
jgi:hypothetical protein